MEWQGSVPQFTAGARLGSGGLGCVVTTRPDAVCLHFGHNEVWDIRVRGILREELRTFQEILDRISSLLRGRRIADDPWLKEYFEKLHGP